MKKFEHINAGSYEEAGALLKKAEGKGDVMAGGTDLLGTYKDRLLQTYPETVINLKTIPGVDTVTEGDGMTVIGAGAVLSKLAKNETVKKNCPALAEAAYSVASPLIRNIATIGGNLCQDVRCWYYRYPDSVGGALNCQRKGGATCYAINGDNRYHSIFGGMHPCGGGSTCARACPAGTDIPTYMQKIREGKWDEAAATLMQYNPMPMITARICPHPCQDECNQNVYGDPVAVHCVERTVGDYILKNAEMFFRAPAVETGKKAAVIGAGPSGLSAAYYLRKAGNDVVVYDRMEKAGGVLRYGIPHYRLPKAIVDRYVELLESMGVTFKMGVEIGKDISMEEIRKKADSVFFGTGAWKQPVLGLEGENLTQFGLNFLVEVNTYLKKAIGNEVLVCGGGNVAMDVALSAVRLGAAKVKLVCLEQENEMPAASEEVSRAKEEGVELLNGWGLSKVKQRCGKVTGLEVKKCLSVRDENGRFAPVYDEKETMVVNSDCIVLATGQGVDTDFLGEDLGKQLKTDRGLIQADMESFQTPKDGYYAGGDAVTGPDIAIRAIKAGRVAAAGMNQDLGGKACESYISCGHGEQFLTFDPCGIGREKAVELKERPLGSRTLADEDAESLSMEEALKEATRCMHCGCYAVNPSDIAPILVMYGAEIVTTERTLSAEELFTTHLKVQDVLRQGELVKEIRIPQMKGEAHYDKKRVRNAIDFAIVSLASCLDISDGVVQDAKIVFGAVAPVPYRMKEVEAFLKGKKLEPAVIEEAKVLAVKNVHLMGKNEYKVFMLKDLLGEALTRAE